MKKAISKGWLFFVSRFFILILIWLSLLLINNTGSHKSFIICIRPHFAGNLFFLYDRVTPAIQYFFGTITSGCT